MDELNLSADNTAVLITDPQIDFLSNPQTPTSIWRLERSGTGLHDRRGRVARSEVLQGR